MASYVYVFYIASWSRCVDISTLSKLYIMFYVINKCTFIFVNLLSLKLVNIRLVVRPTLMDGKELQKLEAMCDSPSWGLA